MRSIHRAVVTGGAGFIGSHMVDLLLAQGVDVRVIDNLSGGNESNLAHQSGNAHLRVDIRDIRALSADDPLFEDVDTVFHFAGIGDIVPSIEKPIDYIDVNLQGTVRVLECSRYSRVERVVYAASSSCYGLANVPTPETHRISPQYPYALSKHLGEQACLHWHHVYGLAVNSIRIFNAYGLRSRTTGAYGAVFGVFLRQKLAGAPFTVVGDGEQSRDFVYVTDVAEAFRAAATTDLVGQAWNVGASRPQTVNRLVELLGGESVHIPDRPGEPRCTWADTSAIARDLGWKPVVNFEDGVAKMVANIEMWRDAPLWDTASIAEATEGWFRYLSPGDAVPS